MEKPHFLSVEDRANRFDERYLFCCRPYIGGDDVIGFDIRGQENIDTCFSEYKFLRDLHSWKLEPERYSVAHSF